MNTKIQFSLLIVVIGATLTLGLDGHQAKCEISEGNGIKVDSCDASKFLSCQLGRCMCNDLGNQLYDYRLEPEKSNSRSKRGLKKKGGKGGSIAGGAIAGGVAGGAVGYIAAKAATKGVGSRSDNKKYEKVFACYGRVGSPCVLDYNNINIVTLSTTTTTTSTTPTPDSTTTIASGNVTTTAPQNTTTTASAVTYDITKIPKCVRNAICTRPSKLSSLSTPGQIVKTEGDPRIGFCMCADGYKASNTDKCEKSGSSQLISGLPVFLSILYATVLSKLI